MTLTPIRARHYPACPACGLPTANRGAHARACAGRIEPHEMGLVLRAGCHAATPSTLPEPCRFQGKVTDLDAARLLLAVERGTRVVLGGNLEWTVSGGLSPLGGHLTRITRECIRLGLAYAREGRLHAAPVHLRSVRWLTRPACAENGALRYRILSGQDSALADCEECLDVPMSGVAYSTDG